MYDNLLANVPTDLWIGGKWRKSSDGGRFDVLDPATENKIASVASATVDDAKAAVDAASDPVLVLPGDMPFVTSATIRAVLAEFERTHALVVPVHAGRHGHPIAMPGRVAAAVARAPVDSTLKDALDHAGPARTELAVDDPGVLRDVDVAGDLRN
jgi:CTP:molybdopterin cytidylyltransferase MocA